MASQTENPGPETGATARARAGTGAPRAAVVLGSLGLLAIVSYLDLLTGDECLFFVFYYAPVALFAWHFGPKATLLMAALAGASWFVIDYFSGRVYAQTFTRYWNAFICFLAFAIMGLVLNRLRRTLNEHVKARRELAKALEEVNHYNEEVRKLQDQLQVVCAWTKRINIDGKWIPLDEFFADKLHFKFTHGISPEAFEELKKTLK